MKKIGIALAIVGIIVLVFLMGQEGEKKDKVALEYSEMEKQLIPLNVEKRELEKQLADIDRQEKKDQRERGTVTVLFTELDKKIYNEIFPMMKEYGYKGVLALSDEEFPGEEGCITKTQFEKLLEAGWSYCTVWDKNRSIDVWNIFLQKKMKKLKVETKPTIYFPENTYKKGYNDSLKEYGYTIVVHHGERNLPLYPKTTKEGNMWYPGVCGMAGEGPKTKLRETVAMGSNIVYTVGFTKKDELYEKATFDRMLQEFQKHEKEEEILVMNFEEARKYHLDMYSKRKGTDMTLEAQRDVIREQIAAVDAKIDALYEKYR